MTHFIPTPPSQKRPAAFQWHSQTNNCPPLYPGASRGNRALALPPLPIVEAGSLHSPLPSPPAASPPISPVARVVHHSNPGFPLLHGFFASLAFGKVGNISMVLERQTELCFSTTGKREMSVCIFSLGLAAYNLSS